MRNWVPWDLHPGVQVGEIDITMHFREEIPMNKLTNESGILDAAPMDQVRDLLFGSQLKEMEIRMQRQEELFQREIADAKDSLKARIDSLENFMKSEISSLLNRLKEEQNERETMLKGEGKERQEGLRLEQRERAESLKAEQRERQEGMAQLTRDLTALGETTERKIAKVSGMLDTTERDIKALLLSEAGSLSNKIDEKYTDSLNALSKTASQIRHDMVHRTSLANMFSEVVFKLSGNGSDTSTAQAKMAAQAKAAAPVQESKPQATVVQPVKS